MRRISGFSGGVAAWALTISGVVSAAEPAGYTLDPQGDLSAMLDCLEGEGRTLVSAHRGGPSAGLPENAIETMDAMMAAVPAIMEVDVARSSDGVHFLMHDDTLDRTTNGTGTAAEQDWAGIRSLRLVDEAGWVTPYSVPSLKAALEWAKDRTILQIDFKRSADYEEVIAMIRETEMEDRVILITYSLDAAKRLADLAPDMLLSVSLDGAEDLASAQTAGIPARNIVAFTGTRIPRPDLYRVLEDADIEVIFGTLGRSPNSIDNVIDRFGTDERYVELSEGGVDVLATDRGREAARALAAAGRLPMAGTCGVSRRVN